MKNQPRWRTEMAQLVAHLPSAPKDSDLIPGGTDIYLFRVSFRLALRMSYVFFIELVFRRMYKKY